MKVLKKWKINFFLLATENVSFDFWEKRESAMPSSRFFETSFIPMRYYAVRRKAASLVCESTFIKNSQATASFLCVLAPASASRKTFTQQGQFQTEWFFFISPSCNSLLDVILHSKYQNRKTRLESSITMNFFVFFFVHWNYGWFTQPRYTLWTCSKARILPYYNHAKFLVDALIKVDIYSYQILIFPFSLLSFSLDQLCNRTNLK